MDRDGESCKFYSVVLIDLKWGSRTNCLIDDIDTRYLSWLQPHG